MRIRILIVLALAATAIPAGSARAQNQTGGTEAGASPPASQPAPSAPGQPTVAGTRARLIRGIAYAPSAAPSRIKGAIWATNRIVHRPYKFGGGHARWNDSGYDCSGLVSYFLHAAGLLRSSMAAPPFMSWGSAGRGRWVTVYANGGHVYAVVAGLRLDTTPYPSRGVEGSDWRPQLRDPSAFRVRHPAGL